MSLRSCGRTLAAHSSTAASRTQWRHSQAHRATLDWDGQRKQRSRWHLRDDRGVWDYPSCEDVLLAEDRRADCDSNSERSEEEPRCHRPPSEEPSVLLEEGASRSLSFSLHIVPPSLGARNLTRVAGILRL